MSDVLSVVIPAHNEADSIPTALRGVYAALTEAGVDHEIVVVDDHCSDGTGDVVRALAADERQREQRHGKADADDDVDQEWKPGVQVQEDRPLSRCRSAR